MMSVSLREIVKSTWAVVLPLFGMAVLSASTLASPITVDSVGVLDPNPNSLTLADAVSNSAANGITLANFQTLMTASFASNSGGVLDFQEQYQGGTWPNNPQNSANNGVTVGNGSANTITATYGVSQSSSLGFFRNVSVTTDGIDAAVNQGTNVVSGGYTTRNGGGSGNVDFSGATPTPVGSGGTSGIGGGYLGIVGTGSPMELDFNSGLSAFGITAIPRGSSRHTQITATLSDNSTFSTTNEFVTTSAVFFGLQLTPAQLSSGLSITKVTLVMPDGVNRYDDLAFVVVPEPASLLLMGVGGVALIALRRGMRKQS